MKQTLALLALVSFSAFAQFNETAAPKPDKLPDPIPACPKKAEVFSQGVVFYCQGWFLAVPSDLRPNPAATDNPSQLRIYYELTGHYTNPNLLQAEGKRLAGI